MALATPKPKADWELYQWRPQEYPKHINGTEEVTEFDPTTKQTKKITRIKPRIVNSEAEEEQVTGKPVERKMPGLPPGVNGPPSLEVVLSRGYDYQKASEIVAEEERAFLAGEKPYGDKPRVMLTAKAAEAPKPEAAQAGSAEPSKDDEKPLELYKKDDKTAKTAQK